MSFPEYPAGDKAAEIADGFVNVNEKLSTAQRYMLLVALISGAIERAYLYGFEAGRDATREPR